MAALSPTSREKPLVADEPPSLVKDDSPSAKSLEADPSLRQLDIPSSSGKMPSGIITEAASSIQGPPMKHTRTQHTERVSRFFYQLTRHIFARFSSRVPELLTIETFESTHHFAITDTSRVKMLHCDPETATEHWQQGKKALLEEIVDESRAVAQAQAQAQSQLKFTTEPTGKAWSAGRRRHPSADEQEVSGAISELGICMVEFEQQAIPIWEDSLTPPVANLRRIGDLSKQIVIDWRLVNGTFDPKLALQLVPARGTVVFKPGEERASITGPLINNPAWNAESFYYITLDPDSLRAQNLVLGRNSATRIFHVNVVRFPSGCPPEATTFQLVRSFWLHNYEEMPREARMGGVLMMMTGLFFVLEKFAWKYLVDCGASFHPDETCTGSIIADYFTELGESWHEGPLITLALFRVFLMLLDFLQERAFRHLRLRGKATRKLRHNLFTVLLQMSNDARLEYDIGDIPEVMDNTCQEAVQHVWIGPFKGAEKFSVLVGSCILFAQSALSTESFWAKLSIAVAAPIMLLAVKVVIKLTERTGQTWRNSVVEAEQHWFSLVQMTEQCYDVVVGYRVADDMAASINEMHGGINKGWVGFADHNKNYQWILRWFFHAVQVVVLITTGLAVRNGTFHLGDFIVVNTTLLNFGKTIVDMAVLMKTITNQAASVQTIANILNSDTKRKVLLRQGLVPGQPAREIVEGQAIANVAAVGHASDGVAEQAQAEDVVGEEVRSNRRVISLVGVSYGYKSGAEKTVLASPKVWLNVEAGQLVCWPRVKEDHEHIGVNTIFKMLAGFIVPETGSIKLPAWWRVIYVPVNPILFDGTLMYNLEYGSAKSKASKDEEREIVWDICQRLGFSAELIGKEFYDVETYGSRLRNRDRVLVSIVRALLHDTDLLLIASALDVLGSSQGRQVLEYLHEYVHNRGIRSRSPFPRALRHQKTVLYSTKFEALQQGVCDSLVKLSSRGSEPL